MALVPRLTLPSLTVGTGVVRIWCADLMFPVRLRFLYQMCVFVLACNIIMSLSILKYFFTVFEAAPLYSFIYVSLYIFLSSVFLIQSLR